MNVSVSVLVNNYNNGPWLRRCLDSIFAQTREADEVIVFDDGSSDDSVEIIRSFGSKVRLISGDRAPGGAACERQARAIAEAFEASRGDHIYLLDGDDAFLPEKLARFETAWNLNPDAVLVQSPMVRINEEDREIGLMKNPKTPDRNWERHFYKQGDAGVFYPTSALAFHRNYLTKRLPLDYSDQIMAWSDMKLSLPSVWYGSVITLDEPLACYRQRRNSVSIESGMNLSYRRTLLLKRCFDSLAKTHGYSLLPVWKNTSYLKGAIRRALPKRIGDYIARSMVAWSRRRGSSTEGSC